MMLREPVNHCKGILISNIVKRLMFSKKQMQQETVLAGGGEFFLGVVNWQPLCDCNFEQHICV